jgi:hypothetical protein
MKFEDIIRLKQNNFEIKLPLKVKEKFVIPQPEAGEAEDKYISRCMGAIGNEYDTQEQALAVCYAQLK